jgi:predicted DCC family thiol-disulfide oxidoreductase YuxK
MTDVPSANASADHGSTQAVVLFDGVCVLCSGWLSFVTARDKQRRFRFMAIQSAEGRAMAQRHGIDPDDPDTLALVIGDRMHVRSDAVLRIAAALPHWRWTALLRLVPRQLRDAVYATVARNRYRWFGRLDACALPDRDGTTHA